MSWDVALAGLLPQTMEPALGLDEEESRLVEFERAVEVQLPESFREFLIHYGTIRFQQAVRFPILEPCPWGQTGEIDWFFGLSDDPIWDIRDAALRTYAGRIPDETIPIATDPAGNLLLLAIEGVLSGRIYFWDHEHRERNGQLPRMLNDLESKGEDTRRLDPHSIIRRWELMFLERLEKPRGYGNVYLVADSFDEFIARLHTAQ